MNNIPFVIYLSLYFFATIYFAVLGCYMLTRRADTFCSRGEQKAKLRLTRTMGVAMFIWAFVYFIYIPPMLLGCDYSHTIYKVYFLVNFMLFIPVLYVLMFTIVQKKVNMLKWVCGLSLPFFILTFWYIITPPQ